MFFSTPDIAEARAEKYPGKSGEADNFIKKRCSNKFKSQ